MFCSWSSMCPADISYKIYRLRNLHRFSSRFGRDQALSNAIYSFSSRSETVSSEGYGGPKWPDGNVTLQFQGSRHWDVVVKATSLSYIPVSPCLKPPDFGRNWGQGIRKQGCAHLWMAESGAPASLQAVLVFQWVRVQQGSLVFMELRIIS